MDFESRVLPELRPTLSLFPGFKLEGNLDWSRSLLSNPPIEKSEHVRTTSRMIPGAAGEMLVKIYEPAQRTEAKLPAMLWIHGGGYVMGHPDMDDALCERFVQEAKCVVVSVDYRLAPEHPYPAAIDDCYASLIWMTDEAESLGIDLDRVAIAGASGGGGLTAALALMVRDKGGPDLKYENEMKAWLHSSQVINSAFHQRGCPSIALLIHSTLTFTFGGVWDMALLPW